MRKLILLVTTLALTGCSSLSKEFENRLACTPDGKAYVVSMYGPLGIASKIDGSVPCVQGEQK